MKDQIKEAAEKILAIANEAYDSCFDQSLVPFKDYKSKDLERDIKTSIKQGIEEYALSEKEEETPITHQAIRELKFEGEGGFSDYVRKFGSCAVVLRMNGGKCYCELPNLYLGEIENLNRLLSLLYGMTGREEFNPK